MNRVLLVIVVACSAVSSAPSICAQKPGPTKKPVVAPDRVVAQYIAAIKNGDLSALAKTYTRPLEGIYTALAAFRDQHQKLIIQTKKLFGAAGVKEVDDKRYKVTLPPIVGGTVEPPVIRKNTATVSASFRVKGLKKPHVTKVILQLQLQEWRIVQVGETPLPVPVRPEASVVEWEVAAEATKRILGFLSRNEVKAASDIVALRKNYMQIVTKEWMLAQKLGKRSPSHPTTTPAKKPKK